MKPKYQCENPECDEESCTVCCDHEYDPSEGYTCLNCGKDGAEAMACFAEAAADAAEDR